ILPVAIEIPFELAEIGKHGLPPPLGAAVFGPPVIIGGGAAIGDKAVDARSAAEESRLLVLGCAPGLCPVAERAAEECLQAGPGEILVEIGLGRIAGENLLGRILVRDVLAGLDEQDRASRVLCEPCGKHAS